MARAHFADVLIGTSGTGALSLLDGATVHVYDQGTTNHIAQTLYAADSGGATIANPLTSDANGKVEFWLDTPARVDLAASKNGFSPSTRTVDVEDVPIAVSGTPTAGDTLVYDGARYVPQAPSGGGSGALYFSENNLTEITPGAGTLPTGVTRHVDWTDGWTVVNDGDLTVLSSDHTRLVIATAGVYEIFVRCQLVAPADLTQMADVTISVVGENMGGDFTGSQDRRQRIGGAVFTIPVDWRAVEVLAAGAHVGVDIRADSSGDTDAGMGAGSFHVGVHRLS